MTRLGVLHQIVDDLELRFQRSESRIDFGRRVATIGNRGLQVRDFLEQRGGFVADLRDLIFQFGEVGGELGLTGHDGIYLSGESEDEGLQASQLLRLIRAMQKNVNIDTHRGRTTHMGMNDETDPDPVYGTRAEHIAWLKARGLQLIEQPREAIASVQSDLLKNKHTRSHLAIELATMMLKGGLLDTPEAAREFIEGIN